jgi:hypothetical protein
MPLEFRVFAILIKFKFRLNSYLILFFLESRSKTRKINLMSDSQSADFEDFIY